jgi:hypothetical protein
MEGEEFTGRAGAESVSIVHAKTIRDPIEFVSWELRELVGPIGCGREGLLQLVVCLAVIPTHPKTTLLNVDVFWGVLGGLADNVWAGCRGEFGLCVKTAGEHFISPSGQHGHSAWSPFRSRNADVFPIALKI